MKKPVAAITPSRVAVTALWAGGLDFRYPPFVTEVHRLDLTRQGGFIVTIYDEDGLRLTATQQHATSAEARTEACKIVDNKVEGPKK